MIQGLVTVWKVSTNTPTNNCVALSGFGPGFGVSGIDFRFPVSGFRWSDVGCKGSGFRL